MTVAPLAGWTVGITAARRREELAAALERHGARVVSGPAIRIVPLADDTDLRDAIRRCVAAPLDYAVATTGVGFRGWLEAADAWGLGEELHRTLAGATILARGPKARGAVRAAQLREAWSPESESSTEVRQYLLAAPDLAGRRVAVQLHGEPLPELVDGLRAAGAEVIEVPVYRWVPPADEQPLHALVRATAAGAIDCVTFTSAPAAANFLRTAHELGRRSEVVDALRGPVLAAAVGSVTAGPLERAGVPVAMPARFRLGALVREVVERLPARARVVVAGGHRLELRGQAVVVDGELVPLPGPGVALLRVLAARPGQVVARAELAGTLLAGAEVDAEMARVQAALGTWAVVATAGSDGYRLAAGATV
jgi:uroporphyrinogen-III synthase